MRRLAPPVLVLVAAAAACAGGAPDRPAAPAGRLPARAAPVRTITTTRTLYRHAAFLWNAAVAALPIGARRASSGHPGDGYRFGAVRDPAAWRAFVAAAEIRDLPEVRFDREMVVFALLDDGTAALSPASWKVDGSGRAVFTFAQAGAEPFDPDAVPGTLAVVDRAGVRSIAFRTLDGRELCTLAL